MTNGTGVPEQDGPSFSFGEMALSAETDRVFTTPNDVVREERSDNAELLLSFRSLMLNEQYSPEILQFADEIVKQMRNLVEQQSDAIDLIESGDEKRPTPHDFEIHIKQMELDRIKYLLRSYYRIRLKKIEKNIIYIFKEESKVLYSRLSEAEQKFAVGFMNIVETHFHRSFLAMLPDKLQQLDKDGAVNHAVAPHLEKFVFCRIRRTVGSYAVSDQATDPPMDLYEGDILCTRFARIGGLVADGSAELV